MLSLSILTLAVLTASYAVPKSYWQLVLLLIFFKLKLNLVCQFDVKSFVINAHFLKSFILSEVNIV